MFKQGEAGALRDESELADHSPIGGEGRVRDSNDLRAAEKILFIPAGPGAGKATMASPITSGSSPVKPWKRKRPPKAPVDSSDQEYITVREINATGHKQSRGSKSTSFNVQDQEPLKTSPSKRAKPTTFIDFDSRIKEQKVNVSAADVQRSIEEKRRANAELLVTDDMPDLQSYARMNMKK